MRYELKAPIKTADFCIKAVILRKPTEKDRADILRKANDLAREKGRMLRESDHHTLAIAHLSGLPIAVVRKFAIYDTYELAWMAHRAFAAEGLA